ncbi:DUF2064 domain-containing protein [Luteibaculum oceani]|uniref:DUF2064 domain-containing protein n=1 Tax=Luteibaculum oceani TaxID=1294296 RepID=UPI001476FBC3|nr:DUF2064 domain-containing protein [Luteibaculum oceani]
MEAVAKPLYGDQNVTLNRKIWSAFKNHTTKAVERSGLDLIQYTLQEGTSFGEKIANAVQSTFSEGYEKVILLGVDNPNLHHNTIKFVADKLADNDWVIEPSEDGGVNIFGIHKEHFNFEEFQSLPWQTEQLLNEFVDTCRAKFQNLYLLAGSPDIDAKETLEAWLLNPQNKLLGLVIKALLFKEKFASPNTGVSKASESKTVNELLRAPPQ